MEQNNLPKHVAIILDGNGRWAKRFKLPRSRGHYEGGFNLARIADHANKRGIQILSVYVFSTENWKRPQEEIDYLMTKPLELINQYKDRILKANIRIRFIGRKDRLSKEMLELMEEITNDTSHHDGMVLNLCVDYGSYDDILQAARKTKDVNLDNFTHNLMIQEPVDLLIRTGGEKRLSNFLLWQSAYAELYFTKKYWPAFKEKHFDKAIKSFSKRHRRFGGL